MYYYKILFIFFLITTGCSSGSKLIVIDFDMDNPRKIKENLQDSCQTLILKNFREARIKNVMHLQDNPKTLEKIIWSYSSKLHINKQGAVELFMKDFSKALNYSLNEVITEKLTNEKIDMYLKSITPNEDITEKFKNKKSNMYLKDITSIFKKLIVIDFDIDDLRKIRENLQDSCQTLILKNFREARIKDVMHLQDNPKTLEKIIWSYSNKLHMNNQSAVELFMKDFSKALNYSLNKVITEKLTNEKIDMYLKSITLIEERSLELNEIEDIENEEEN